MSVQLISIDLNLNSDVQPTAVFRLSNFVGALVNVSGEAIANNSTNVISFQQNCVVTDRTITVNLPRTTSMVRINFTNLRLVKCYPEQSLYNFSRPDRDLFVLVNFLNCLAIDTSGLDHKPVETNEKDRVFGHQIGPHRSSRAMAMFHMALLESYIVLNGKFNSYLNLPRVFNSGNSTVTTRVAMVQAGFNVLIHLYPSHDERLNPLLSSFMSGIPNNSDKTMGVAVAYSVSNEVIKNRSNDKSDVAEKKVGVDYIPSGNPGEWNKDPISNLPLALGSDWGKVTPFVMTSSSQFRCPVPPALDSPQYMMAFDDVKANGGDGVVTPTVRNDDKTEIGYFWAYDGVPSLCAPPRLYNQVAKKILYQSDFTAEKVLHSLVVINVAMADSAIACWESKYFYKFWRPITALREPDGLGNVNTIIDPTWTPLGAPASNLSNRVNFTPPFPAYPSGHSTFGATIFQILRRVLGTDLVNFTFVSDEYNGHTVDNTGERRPYKERVYNKLSQAEEENGESRIYLGVHFDFDKTSGDVMGRSVGDYVYDNLYKVVV